MRPYPKPAARPRSKRRNDGPWRQECAVAYGLWCRASGVHAGPIQCDHVWPRSQGGPSVVENGLFLCESHHDAKTASRIVIDPEWLTPEQIDWLAQVGWVSWNADGQPSGRGMRHFAPRRVRGG